MSSLPPVNAPQLEEHSVIIFRALGDNTRLRIVYVLLQGERSVGSIADALQMTKSAISHQMRELRLSKVVAVRREGKQKVYRIRHEQVMALLETARELALT